MADPLFVSQAKLESWLEKDEVTFEDNVLTILAQDKSYELSPAAKIVSLLDGEDAKGWIGQTMSIEEIEAAGAEHFADSVIVGDNFGSKVGIARTAYLPGVLG